MSAPEESALERLKRSSIAYTRAAVQGDSMDELIRLGRAAIDWTFARRDARANGQDEPNEDEHDEDNRRLKVIDAEIEGES